MTSVFTKNKKKKRNRFLEQIIFVGYDWNVQISPFKKLDFRKNKLTESELSLLMVED